MLLQFLSDDRELVITKDAGARCGVHAHHPEVRVAVCIPTHIHAGHGERGRTPRCALLSCRACPWNALCCRHPLSQRASRGLSARPALPARPAVPARVRASSGQHNWARSELGLLQSVLCSARGPAQLKAAGTPGPVLRYLASARPPRGARRPELLRSYCGVTAELLRSYCGSRR
jgi:hypothetical protein